MWRPASLGKRRSIEHCRTGAGVWDWAANDDVFADPDIVPACSDDILTMGTGSAARILRERHGCAQPGIALPPRHRGAQQQRNGIDHLGDLPEIRGCALVNQDEES